MTLKPAFKAHQQAHREAIWAVLLALGYFVWWYISAYEFSPVDTAPMPVLYWGMPLWFLLACVIGPIMFTVLCALMVKFLYRDIPLDDNSDTDYE